MINIIDVAKTVNSLLNGTYPNIPSNVLNKRPHYNFLTKAVGIKLDTIANSETGENFIPVYVDTMGGSISPVPGLMESNYNVPIALWFPVDRMNDFLGLDEYISQLFVGKVINFGGHSGKGLCNISLCQLGEIQDVDIEQFYNWVSNDYKKPINSNVPYMCMSFNLYITTCEKLGEDDGPLFGNNVKTTIFYNYKGKQYIDLFPIFTKTSVSVNSSETSEQILGEKYVKGLPSTSAYAVPLNLVSKKSDFYTTLIQAFFDKELCDITFTINIYILKEGEDFLDPGNVINTFHTHAYIPNGAVNMDKGELITIGLNFADRKDIENG